MDTWLAFFTDLHGDGCGKIVELTEEDRNELQAAIGDTLEDRGDYDLGDPGVDHAKAEAWEERVYDKLEFEGSLKGAKRITIPLY